MIIFMGDKTSTEPVGERETADPYGDVALGVECAWPQRFDVMTISDERRHFSCNAPLEG